MNNTLESLRWQKMSVLNDGFVCLVDVMGTDQSIVQAARVSYGRDKRSVYDLAVKYAEEQGMDYQSLGSPKAVYEAFPLETQNLLKEKAQRPSDEDRGLIRYLMRHRHTTPFEMCELKFLVRVPMDCWRQWIRHRMANVNEYSTRYSEAIDSAMTTSPLRWRLQSPSNKQGSSGFVEDWPEGHFQPDILPGDYLSEAENKLLAHARKVYEERLEFGVAREQARKDLPLSTYTEAYWKIDLHNLFHFLGLRMDSHAQQEIREYANAIGSIVKQLFPLAWGAFADYRLGAMTLSRMEIEIVSLLARSDSCFIDDDEWEDLAMREIKQRIPNKREQDECIAKLKRLEIMEDMI